MKTTIHKCDKCGVVFEPKEGFGFIKLQYIDPKNPLWDGSNNHPNIKEVRFDELCQVCTNVLFEKVDSFIKIK
jgi:rubredoxin